MQIVYLQVMLPLESLRVIFKKYMSKKIKNFNENEIQPVDLCLQAELDIKDFLCQILELEKKSFSDNYSYSTLDTAYKNDNYDIFVVLSGNEVIGYLIAYLVLDEAEILRVAVKEEFKRRKVCSILLSFAEKSLLDKGIKDLILECRVSNLPALTLYEKSGFKRLGVRKNFYENPVEDAIIMKKEIVCWRYACLAQEE